MKLEERFFGFENKSLLYGYQGLSVLFCLFSFSGILFREITESRGGFTEKCI